MKPFKAPIDEGLATDITGQMMYCLFIDLYSLSIKKGGLMLNMFPNVGAKKLHRWLGSFPTSQSFSKNADILKSMSQKFGANSNLKTLYRVINTLKTKQTDQEKNDSRINDIQLVMSKIERVIKSKLTPEEKQLFATITSELEDAADNAGKSIEGSVGASTIKPETPQEPQQPETQPTQKAPEKQPEEPEEKPAPEEPSTEKPAPEEPSTEKPAPKEPSTEKPAPKEKPASEEKPSPEGEEEKEKTGGKEKKESITYEEYQQYLKSLIKEIVKKKLGL